MSTFNSTHLMRLLALICCLALFLSCRKDDDDNFLEPDPDPGVEAGCDSTLLPVVFVHGFLASGDTYAKQVQRFALNGFCPDRLHAFDWNTLGDRQAAALELDAFIDEIRAATGAAQVHLAGHSAGGGLGYIYLSDTERAAKVSRFAYIGSAVQDQPAGPFGEMPMVNIYSNADRVANSGDINGAGNVMLPGLDHYQIATEAGPFEVMYRFFTNNRDPKALDIIPEEEIFIGGKLLTFGENKPKGGGRVEIHELDPESGLRRGAQPQATLVADERGGWGPWQAKPNVPYEFYVPPADAGDRPIHYYREGFVRSSNLVYLRTLPPPSSQAGLLLAALPRDDRQSVVAIFSASRAVIHQRDELRIDDFDLATEQLAPEQATNIAFFLFDDGDQTSSGNPHALFNLLPVFITGVDYFISAETERGISLTFNGRRLNARNWKSASEGVIVVVFD